MAKQPQPQSQPLHAHNIGPGYPLLTHARFTEYLFECAARWREQPNGADQAQRVQLQALEMQRTHPGQCGVCQAAQRPRD